MLAVDLYVWPPSGPLRSGRGRPTFNSLFCLSFPFWPLLQRSVRASLYLVLVFGHLEKLFLQREVSRMEANCGQNTLQMDQREEEASAPVPKQKMATGKAREGEKRKLA